MRQSHDRLGAFLRPRFGGRGRGAFDVDILDISRCELLLQADRIAGRVAAAQNGARLQPENDRLHVIDEMEITPVDDAVAVGVIRQLRLPDG